MSLLNYLDETIVKTFLKLPLSMRLNYLYNILYNLQDIDWTSVNALLFESLDMYDYNLCNKVYSLEDIINEKNKITKAENLKQHQPYKKIICLKCDKPFYLNKKEVDFYKEKNYKYEKLPCFCEYCQNPYKYQKQ